MIYFASPNGNGAGTESSPFSLTAALNSSNIKPGDTLYLKGGVYKGKFTSTLKGGLDAPITITSAPNEWAIIDSVGVLNRVNILTIRGENCIYKDFEVTSTNPVRKALEPGSFPGSITRGEGVHLFAPKTKLINLVVHDAAAGIAAWEESYDSEIYGCILYNNGWLKSDNDTRHHGHNLYIQNSQGAKVIENNISFNAFDKGNQSYGSSTSTIKNLTFQNNFFFNNGLPSYGKAQDQVVIYGGISTENITYKNNCSYGRDFNGNMTIGGDTSKDIVFDGNYINHLTRLRHWKTATIKNNTFIRSSTLIELYHDSMPAWDINNNTYIAQELKYTPFITNLSGIGKGLSFEQWKIDTKFDSLSSYTKGAPTSNKVFIKENKYAPKTYYICVYNWEKEPIVKLNISSFAPENSKYKLINAQNIKESAILGSVIGGEISLNMNQNVATPVGGTEILPSLEFGMFILEIQSNLPPAPVPTPPPVKTKIPIKLRLEIAGQIKEFLTEVEV